MRTLTMLIRMEPDDANCNKTESLTCKTDAIWVTSAIPVFNPNAICNTSANPALNPNGVCITFGSPALKPDASYDTLVTWGGKSDVFLWV